MDFVYDAIPSFSVPIGLPMDVSAIIKANIFDDIPAVKTTPSTAAKAKQRPTKKTVAVAKRNKSSSSTASSSTSSRKRQSKPRRIIPKTKTYIDEAEPKDSDVVSGRGGKSNKHPGNKAYWLVIMMQRAEYRACTSDEDKNKIAQEVVDFIHRQNGRYVQMDEESGRWFILPDLVALDKAKQALRDKHVPVWVTGEKAETTKKPSLPAAKRRSPKKKQPQTNEEITTDSAPTIFEMGLGSRETFDPTTTTTTLPSYSLLPPLSSSCLSMDFSLGSIALSSLHGGRSLQGSGEISSSYLPVRESQSDSTQARNDDFDWNAMLAQAIRFY
jgi:hypothetical protein